MKDYTSPYYAELTAKVEEKLGLPSGLLHSIVTRGERSNADQVSEAGAKTVFQVIPATRDALLKKYGIDAYLSPENAAEAAGLLLRESLKRNDGDVAAAVGEYHGGTDRKNWGPRTQAYIGRVTTGLKADDELVAQAKAWKENRPLADSDIEAAKAWKAARDVKPQIPGTQAPTAQPEKSTAASIGDQLIGAGETALTLATAIPSAISGSLGFLNELGGQAVRGELGTPEGSRKAEEAAASAAGRFVYSPRSEVGRENVMALGDVANDVLTPMAGMVPQLGALGALAKSASRQVTAAAQPAAAAVIDKARAVPQMIRREQAPTSGTLGSVGAAGTDAATLRTQAAADLPVPVQLTKGQRERSQEQLRFETETAKDPAKGRDLREFAADQNAKVMQNLDAFVEGTGAVLPDDMEVGRSVGTALASRMAREKAQIRTAYKAAEKAGEMREPVPLAPVIKVLDENVAAEGTAPVLAAARKELSRLTELEGSGESLSIGGLENLRKFIVANTDESSAPNMRAASILKGAIDSATENAGGDIYKSARALRRNFASRYENRALINDLVSNRKAGSVDRKVALENVVRRSVFQGSREELGYLRAVLQGEGENGQQAWREVQGAVARQIQERALSNVGTDIRGNQIVSAAKLDSAIKQLEVGKKLDFVFGKQGAQQFRDLNELAKVIYTQPPGTVNTSNTASVLLAALAESGVTGSMTGLPVPVLSGLRVLSMHVKDRRIQRRIDEALGRAKAQEKRAPGPNTPPRTFH